MFAGLDLTHVTNLYGTGMTWDFIDRLRDTVKGNALVAQSDAAILQDQIAVFKALGGGWASDRRD